MTPPLINGYLLGRRVELRLRGGDIERGVVVGITLSGDRGIKLTFEHDADYREDLDAWLPKRPRTEWRRHQADIEMIAVIDFIETKKPEPEK